jgi:ABC-type polysaccharide/polyol phosphate export permease
VVDGLVTPFRTLVQHRKVIGTFVRRDIRARYVNSVLGLSWAVIQPLALLTLYTFVFSVVLGIRLGRDTSTTGFALYLFCGMLPWLAFAEGVTRSASAIVDHAHLIKKVVFPSEILPAYVVASALVTELVGLAVFVVAAGIVYRLPGWPVLLLPVVIALQVMLTLGLGWFLASLNVFLRDVGQVLGLGLTLWMLLTPIFYPPDMVPARFRWVLAWNPLHYLVQGYRDVLLDHTLPAPAHLAALGTLAVGAFLAGSWFFRRSKTAFIDVL